jgi:hypothetical protein
MKTHECVIRLMNAGISFTHATALRRIAMQLHRWHERECGDEYGCVERDEATKKTYYHNGLTGRRWATRDMETGAHSRLNKIMENYPSMQSYVQGDPRGASLYIITQSDILEGKDIDTYYNRGIAVYK